MRPRTRSVVNVREYFRADGCGAPEMEDDSGEEDNWMAIAMAGAPSGKNKRAASSYKNKKSLASSSYCAFPAVVKAAGQAKRGRTSTLDSWDGTDVEDELLDTDCESDDEDVDGIPRVRTCSHERRISFDDDVDVVEIPSRASFDAEYKQRVWYTSEELRRQAY